MRFEVLKAVKQMMPFCARWYTPTFRKDKLLPSSVLRTVYTFEPTRRHNPDTSFEENLNHLLINFS
jgi:hypothetical protein